MTTHLFGLKKFPKIIERTVRIAVLNKKKFIYRNCSNFKYFFHRFSVFFSSDPINFLLIALRWKCRIISDRTGNNHYVYCIVVAFHEATKLPLTAKINSFYSNILRFRDADYRLIIENNTVH